MQLYYRCEEGFEARAEAVLTKACKKLVVERKNWKHIFVECYQSTTN
jgi:hypothetical protein